MNRFSVWNPVIVQGDNTRTGQAGVVFATNPAKPDEVAVKFDLDGIVVIIPNDNLKTL